ncbi:MAG: hypothetical protein DRQ47_06790 [Gammaproteobacteria bacterium]|nr:MAG: hypothetical protein DRQ47_06790 [Gammaproteobacteria bacterium]
METQTSFSAALFAVWVASNVVVDQQPLPAVQITDDEMPQFVKEYTNETEEHQMSAKAVAIYHDLRKSFGVSHVKMGSWLGVKRRSLYNWMNEPEKAKKYGEQIEYRLAALVELKEDMESEHLLLLEKIAFSPIYGDPKFGESILEGRTGIELKAWYDKLFSQFESYRGMLQKHKNII